MKKECPFTRGKDHHPGIEVSKAIQWPNIVKPGRETLQYTLACESCATFIRDYQFAHNQVIVKVHNIEDVLIEDECPVTWRSHGCEMVLGHKLPHECGCGDEPTEYDELHHVNPLFNRR